MRKETFNYALEGFGGVVRQHVDLEKPAESVGPANGADGGAAAAADPAALAADAREKYAAAEAVSAFCDLVADNSGIVESNRINTWQPETRVSHAYATALQFSQVIDVEPDEETKAKIERWRGLLMQTVKERDLVTDEEVEVTRETELVKRYREKMLAYYGEALTYNTMRISAMAGQDEQAVHAFAVNAPLMQMKVRAAENDWASNGFRDTYDRIAAAIASVEGRSFALLKQRYKEDFMRSLLTNPSSGANFCYTAPIPADFARGELGLVGILLQLGLLPQQPQLYLEQHPGRRRLPHRVLRDRWRRQRRKEEVGGIDQCRELLDALQDGARAGLPAGDQPDVPAERFLALRCEQPGVQQHHDLGWGHSS